MRRFQLFTLILFALFVAEGCRRSSDTPRGPVGVNEEKDLPANQAGANDIMTALKPTKRHTYEFKTLPRKPGAAGNVFEFPEDAFEPSALIEFKQSDDPNEQALVKLAQDQLEAAKKARELKKKLDILREIGDAQVNFIKNNPVTAHSYENFRKYLFRQELVVKRNLIDVGQYGVAFMHESDQPDQILAFQSDVDERGKQPTYLSNATIVPLVPAEVTSRIARQELRVLWRNYVAYSTALTQKTPPEARDAKKFVKYLEENAPPVLAKYVDEGVLRVNFPADARNFPNLVAAHAGPVNDTVGHTAINAKGGPTFVAMKAFDFSFPVPKK